MPAKITNEYGSVYHQLKKMGLDVGGEFEPLGPDATLNANVKTAMQKSLSVLLEREVKLEDSTFSISNKEIETLKALEVASKDPLVLADMKKKNLSFEQWIEAERKDKPIISDNAEVKIESRPFGLHSGFAHAKDGGNLSGEALKNERDRVKATQTMLQDLGYDVGKKGADGKLGQDTYAALLKFGKENGLDFTNEDKMVPLETMVKLVEKHTEKFPAKTALVTAALDGKTLDEVKETIKPKPVAEKPKPLYAQIDRNGDGITEAELVDYFLANKIGINAEESKKLAAATFEKFDTNREKTPDARVYRVTAAEFQEGIARNSDIKTGADGRQSIEQLSDAVANIGKDMKKLNVSGAVIVTAPDLQAVYDARENKAGGRVTQ